LQLGKVPLNLPKHGSVQSGIKLIDADSQHRTWCLTTILRPMRLGSLGSRSILERGQADNQSSRYNKPKTSVNVYYIFVALAAGDMQPLAIAGIQSPLRSVKLVDACLNILTGIHHRPISKHPSYSTPAIRPSLGTTALTNI